ncbi:hypothetical protein [Deinococcus sp. Marseille-Q6407]|nr:hypothetical protein [Deinococcus sp. Marseille-Q6407]
MDADSRYGGSTRTLNNITRNSDNVFSDGVKARTPSMGAAARA